VARFIVYIDLFVATFNSTHRLPTTAAGGPSNTPRSGGASRRRHIPIQLYLSTSQSESMPLPLPHQDVTSRRVQGLQCRLLEGLPSTVPLTASTSKRFSFL
jgi:hypothetical protein